MTKKINKVRILERLRDRFELEEGRQPEFFEVIEKIFLITNADELLKDYKTITSVFSRSHASGSGYEDAYEVPDGKRITVLACRVVRTGGDMTAANILIAPEAGSGTHIKIKTIGAGSDIETELLSMPVVMDEGMVIQTYLTAVSADSTFSFQAYVIEEDAF